MGFLGISSCFYFSVFTYADHNCIYHSTIPEEYCRRFSLAELQKATNNFDKSFIIENGAFARVYKGHLAVTNGSESCGGETSKTIAIKRFYRNSTLQQEVYYKSELQLLCQLNHPNIVLLLGYCIDRGEKMLVYDYMAKGSLFGHLCGAADTEPLSWKRRLEICMGAARGLHYLHSGAKYAVIHGDIKSSNILLDKNWEPQIADFEFSVRGPLSMSKKPIRIDDRLIMGTLGYLAPEYLIHNEFTEKSDVYSFGMLLLEVVCAKRPFDLLSLQIDNPILQDSHRHPISAVFECVRQENTGIILDPFLVEKIAPACLVRYMSIAERCLDYERINRPAMGEVEVELERSLQLQQSADELASM